MKNQTFLSVARLCAAAFTAAVLSAFTPTSHAAVRTWTGNGVLEEWRSPLNWQGLHAPDPGDDLVFPADVPLHLGNNISVNSYLPGTVFRTITFSQPGSVEAVYRGNRIALTGGLTFTGSPLAIHFPTRLAGNATFKCATSVYFYDPLVGGLFNLYLLLDTAPIDLNGFTLTLTGDKDVWFNDRIMGSGAIVCDGPICLLKHDNSFSGSLTIKSGSVLVENKDALTTQTVRLEGGTLDISDDVDSFNADVIADQKNLSGGRLHAGVYSGNPPTLQWTGRVTPLSGSFGWQVERDTVLSKEFGAGSGAVAKFGPNLLRLSFPAITSWTGQLAVVEGLLDLDGAAGRVVNGPVLVSNNTNGVGTLRWLRNQQCNPNVTLTVTNGGLANLNGHSDAVSALTINGATVQTGAGLLGVSGNLSASFKSALPATFTGTLRMDGNTNVHVWTVSSSTNPVDFVLNADVTSSLAGASVRKAGNGLLQWGGDSSLAAIEIAAGQLDYTGLGPGMNVTLNSGTLSGGGTVGHLTASPAGGRVIPGGAFGGSITCSNVQWNAATRFKVRPATISGTSLRARGTVDLGNATLELDLAPDFFASVTPGQQFTILQHDGVTLNTGTFQGLPEGATLRITTSNGVASFNITYVGGGLNDVVLTYAVPATGNTRTWTGAGANANWSTAQNWSNNVAPVAGDALVFPVSGARQVNTNDFPANRAFETLRVTGGNYICRGASITVNNGITVTDGSANLNLPIACQFDQTWQNLSAAGSLTLSNVDLAGHVLTLDTAVAGLVGINAPAVISGTGHLIKAGPGQLQMTGTNTYVGPTTVAEGELVVAGAGKPGAGNGDTIVLPGAELTLGGNTALNLSENILLGGTIKSAGTNHQLTGFVTLNDGAAVEVLNNALTLLTVDGSGALTKIGAGELKLTGSLANTFSGGTDIQAGKLTLAKNAGVAAVSSPILIGSASSGGNLSLGASNQIPDTASITMGNPASVFDVAGFHETIADLTMQGGAVLTGAGVLRLNTLRSLASPTAVAATISGNLAQISAGFQDWLVEDTDGAASDLIVSATVTTPSGATPRKVGEGRLVIGGPYQATALEIAEGEVQFNATSTTTVRLSGGRLSGTGTVGTMQSLALGGEVAPGLSPGIFSSSNVTWNASTTFDVEVLNATPGSGHDQLKATGGVTLGNATLNVSALPGFASAAGSQFVIIDNDGTDVITNTFAFLPEGALVDAGNGVVFRISYAGGSNNNDVVLTTVTTGITRIWTGLGANANWNTPSNWVGNVAPQAGDSMLFPADATNRLNTINNYAAGTAFGSIRCERSGFTFVSGSIVLHDGLTFTNDGGTNIWSVNLTTALPQTFAMEGVGTVTFGNLTSITNNGQALTFAVDGGTMIVPGVITGSGALTKAGAGQLVFNGSNTFSGQLTIAQGELLIGHTNALGTAANATTIEPLGRLRLASNLTGSIAEDILLRGLLISDPASYTLTGPIEAPDGGAGYIRTDGTLTCTNAMGGFGSLSKDGVGTLIMSGTASNGFFAGFSLLQGNLHLNKPAGINAIEGPLTVGDGINSVELRLLANNQISDATTVTLHELGYFNLNSKIETITGLVFNGGDIETSAGELRLLGGLVSNASSNTATIHGNFRLDGTGPQEWNIADGAATPDLAVSGNLTSNSGATVNKTGAGRLDFNESVTLNDVTVTAGEVHANDDIAGVNFLLAGGTLGGTGLVSSISGTNGVIAPGASPGVLGAESIALSPGLTFQAELNNATRGTGYDGLDVSTDVSLGGAALAINLATNFVPAVGTAFTLINNLGVGAVSGTFNGLPEGGYLGLNGKSFRITYHGGTGNDVVLLRTNAPPATFTAITGATNNAKQLVAAGLAGLTYGVEATTNLTPVIQWTPIGNAVAGTNGALTFTDTNAAAFPIRFYRAASP